MNPKISIGKKTSGFLGLGFKPASEPTSNSSINQICRQFPAKKWPFWHGEFTWPLRRLLVTFQRLGIKRSRIESPGRWWDDDFHPCKYSFFWPKNPNPSKVAVLRTYTPLLYRFKIRGSKGSSGGLKSPKHEIITASKWFVVTFDSWTKIPPSPTVMKSPIE